MTEEEKMLAGHVYDAADPELMRHIVDCHDALYDYNALRPSQLAERTALIKSILGRTGEEININQPFRCDYGCNISSFLTKRVSPSATTASSGRM